MQLPFLPQIRKAGCNEIVTTFALSFAVIFIVAFVANPGINFLQTLQIIFRRPVDGRSGGDVTAVAAMNTSVFRQGLETSPSLGNYYFGVIKPTTDRRSNSRQ
jgi:hypothetical protein